MKGGGCDGPREVGNLGRWFGFGFGLRLGLGLGRWLLVGVWGGGIQYSTAWLDREGYCTCTEGEGRRRRRVGYYWYYGYYCRVLRRG